MDFNKEARQFLNNNPDEKYWYYSPGLRVPRPELRRRSDWTEDPWEPGRQDRIE